MRLVLDTNVVISALLWGGNPRLLVEAADQSRIELYTSTAMTAELQRVLRQDKFAIKVTAYGFSLAKMLDKYESLCCLIEPASVPRTVRDPDDDVVIGTAVAAKADSIVSGVKDLLQLGRYENIDILSAAAAAVRLTF